MQKELDIMYLDNRMQTSRYIIDLEVRINVRLTRLLKKIQKMKPYLGCTRR